MGNLVSIALQSVDNTNKVTSGKDRTTAIRVIDGREKKQATVTAWENPYPQGSLRGRRESLLRVMESIWTARWISGSRGSMDANI
jgi:hypothetical protein